MEVVLGIPFFTLSNADVRFAEGELTWRSQTAVEALPNTRRLDLIDRKEFAPAALNENEDSFVGTCCGSSRINEDDDPPLS